MRRPISAAVFIIALASPVIALATPGPIVETRNGAIEGVVENGIQVYRGIPFAAPPVDDLRWGAPQPVTPWNGVRITIEPPPACMQHGSYPPDSPPENMSEDCLYLNVWKPASAPHGRLPVMVWIYGGGLENGSASIPLYAGNELARKDVIVVTANYRLGVFGFLALPQLTKESGHDSSGDYGILDQIAALRWVHDNIVAFGGDPDNVTVFGQSSGSISISALVASPLAKGLFQRAIGESGGLFEPLGLVPELALAGAERQGQDFMIRSGAASLAALRREPAAALIKIPFSPNLIVDGYAMPRSPYEAYAKGESNDVPLILGWNADEGRLFIGDSNITVGNYRQQLERAFPSILVRLLASTPGTDNRDARAAAAAFHTDMRFRWDMWTWARLATRRGAGRIFLYEFTRTPPYLAGSRYGGLGATHGMEMQYVFNHLDTGVADWSAEDYRLANVMSSYWANFAKTGDPNGPALPEWPQFREGQQLLMQLGKTIRAEPVSNTAPLRRMSLVYETARYIKAHMVVISATLAVVLLTGVAALVLYICRRRALRVKRKITSGNVPV